MRTFFWLTAMIKYAAKYSLEINTKARNRNEYFGVSNGPPVIILASSIGNSVKSHRYR